MDVAGSQAVRLQNQAVDQTDNRGVSLCRFVSSLRASFFKFQFAPIHVRHQRGQGLIRFSEKPHNRIIQLGQRHHHWLQIRFQQISQCIQRFEIQWVSNRDP